MSSDPYDFHLIALVYGESPAALADRLVSIADSIRRGERGERSMVPPHGAAGTWTLRGGRDRHEEAGACRLRAVYRDGEGNSADEPVAMFRDPEQAGRFAEGRAPNDDGSPGCGDGSILRADVTLSVWNSYAPDLYGKESEDI